MIPLSRPIRLPLRLADDPRPTSSHSEAVTSMSIAVSRPPPCASFPTWLNAAINISCSELSCIEGERHIRKGST